MYIIITKFVNKIIVITYNVYCLCIIIIPYHFIEFLLSIIIYICILVPCK